MKCLRSDFIMALAAWRGAIWTGKHNEMFEYTPIVAVADQEAGSV